MRLFDDDSIEIPPVRLKSLQDDPKGQELLERLRALDARRQDAKATLHRENQPLADLMAEADELAAQALVGDADEEEAQAAEDDVQAARRRVEDARRALSQCDRAETLVRDKLRKRAATVHEENTEAVRSVHRVLLNHALQAERRAAALLRILREFEQQYARYGTDEASARHPQYLTEHDRTLPPRALMGPARATGGTVFDRSEAAAWMRRTADRLEVQPPPLLDVESLDFETAETAPEYVDVADVNPEAMSTGRLEAHAAATEDAADASADGSADDGAMSASGDRAHATDVDAGSSTGESSTGESPTDDVATEDAFAEGHSEAAEAEADPTDAEEADAEEAGVEEAGVEEAEPGHSADASAEGERAEEEPDARPDGAS